MRELVRICAIALVGAAERLDVVARMVIGDELQCIGDALHEIGLSDRRHDGKALYKALDW
jgi:hypothetical protein